MCDYLGDSFVKGDGSAATLSDVTAGKLVLVMYSASW
jgi:hypothetical protein